MSNKIIKNRKISSSRKTFSKKITEIIGNFSTKKYKFNDEYQRQPDAWSQKNKSMLVDSVINDYYIPPILIANGGEIVDGRQRITTLLNFIDNKFKWSDNENQKLSFKDLSYKNQEIIRNHKLVFNNMGDKLSSEKIKNTFIRINENSIKLNTSEFILAKIKSENRKMLSNIANSKYIEYISNIKKKRKRFYNEYLIMTAIVSVEQKKGNVRNNICKYFSTSININEIEKKTLDVLKLMYSILGNDTAPAKSFKIFFYSVFAAFWENIKNKNIYNEDNNKQNIKNEIVNSIPKFSELQIGGGNKYDSWKQYDERSKIVKEILKNYNNVDKKRSVSRDNKLKLWNQNNKKCVNPQNNPDCKVDFHDINEVEVDHILPYTKGGLTVNSNLQLLCQSCNRKKGSKNINNYDIKRKKNIFTKLFKKNIN